MRVPIVTDSFWKHSFRWRHYPFCITQQGPAAEAAEAMVLAELERLGWEEA
jgi:hypothetical protein